MAWRWTFEHGRFALRWHPRPSALADAAFLGRGTSTTPFAPQDAVRLRQVHGPDVLDLDGPCADASADGAATSTAGLPLTVRVADCLPIVLADPEGRLAVVHAGWRGLAAGIVEEAIGGFRAPERLEVIVGPAIGPCCFQVGPEVARLFPCSLAPASPRAGGGPRVDLGGETRRRLQEQGVLPTRISAPAPCTRCHQHLLYSHRGSGGGPGRNLAYAILG